MLCTMLCLLWGSLSANSLDILVYEHENLRSGQVEALDSLRGKPSLLLFFQPGCKWCYRQARGLEQLQEVCPDRINVAALGVFGNRHELKKELKRLRPAFPAFKAGKDMLSDLDGVPATPVMLLADHNGGFKEVFSGYIPKEDLQEYLEANSGIDCNLN